ncbi:hypothetical protein [Aquimonas sp.]|jgi:hypothetical protein|uniref:hypothetical protein n=1 Tax=Aquimonas sp. TaxID=1872588 RepID=UPI0037BEDB74
MNTKTIEVQFTIAYVGFGGNAGHGEYFYSVKPEIVTVGRGQSPVSTLRAYTPRDSDAARYLSF